MSSPDFLATILADAGKAGVYHLPHTDKHEIFAAAKQAGLMAHRVDLARIHDKAGLLAAIGRALQFPSWYGRNLDALADCLSDLSWLTADGHLIVLEHCDGIHSAAAADFLAVIDILGQAASDWREQGVPFWCLIEMQANGFAWLPTEP